VGPGQPRGLGQRRAGDAVDVDPEQVGGLGGDRLAQVGQLELGAAGEGGEQPAGRGERVRRSPVVDLDLLDPPVDRSRLEARGANSVDA
jgi:hypothetical protein